ncbi:Gfo/Idh/MocA family oxidoreductase [soil metagenome]
MNRTPVSPVTVGIVGAGFISDIYLANLTTRFDNVRVVAVADLSVERAEARAAEYGIAAMTVDDLLADPGIELVVNLTVPAAHAEVAMRAVAAGKSVYNEKPLTATREQGQALLALARDNGVFVGGAPDTFLGGALQTARKLIDDGAIGRPIAVNAIMYTHGHESWHPDPGFYYQPGAGPMFDMGPYYVTALVSLLGPIVRVVSSTGVGFAERIISSEPKFGETIHVNTPTHIAATLDFANGAIATLTTSFDIYDTVHSRLTVHGAEGSLQLPDPNTFGGTVSLLQPAAFLSRRDPLSVGRTPDDRADPNRVAAPRWEDVPLTHGYTDNSRGIGVADLARSIRDGSPARASGELACHVLDVMHATLESSDQNRHIAIASTVDRPEGMPAS